MSAAPPKPAAAPAAAPAKPAAAPAVFTDSAQPSYDEAIQPTTGKYVIFPTHI